MDYIIASLLRWIDARLRKILSYDIMCQWSKFLKERLKKLPPLVACNILLHLFRFVIPKMHIKAHKSLCMLLFSLDYVAGSGQTDAEGIERAWSAIGRAAGSTRRCGPGARHDQLDDHWGHWNWMKLVGSGGYWFATLLETDSWLQLPFCADDSMLRRWSSNSMRRRSALSQCSSSTRLWSGRRLSMRSRRAARARTRM